MSKKEDELREVRVTITLKTIEKVKTLGKKTLWVDALDGVIEGKVVAVDVDEAEAVVADTGDE